MTQIVYYPSPLTKANHYVSGIFVHIFHFGNTTPILYVVSAGLVALSNTFCVCLVTVQFVLLGKGNVIDNVKLFR